MSPAATQALRARGVDVLEAVADVSREQDVRRLLDTGDQGRPPLRGILHCAGVLADAKIDAQTHETFARVFDAKARSALHLHRITLELELELDLFVLFSSVSAVVGNTGQANYAAANAFLDGLAVQRRGAGLPALSVAWGAIAETGMLAHDPDVSRHLASLGVQALETDTALAALEACLQSGAAEAGVFSLDWTHWERLNGNLPEASPYAELVGRGGERQLLWGMSSGTSQAWTRGRVSSYWLISSPKRRPGSYVWPRSRWMRPLVSTRWEWTL